MAASPGAIHLRGLSYAHTSAATVLDAADLDLVADREAHATAWVGVVGANGSGKTTLLRLLAGELVPTDGTVEIHADVAPRLVHQGVDTLTEDVRAFASTWDGAAERLRRRLELDPDDLDDQLGRGWRALSPGQRRRWQIAAAVSDRPDVLLLDEPTNHLDARSRDLVLSVLEGVVGLGLVVSHDRGVLERLTSRTLRLHGGGVELHAGAYLEASARWRAAELAQREAHDRATNELQRERRILGEVRRERHGAESRPRRERRLAGARQPDAREAGRKFAQRKAEAALAQRVTQMHARAERAEAARDDLEVRREHGGEVRFRHAVTGRPVLAEVTGDVAHAGGAPWLHDVDVALHRTDRVHLTGANGAGKTTLVRAITAELTRRGEVVANLPQELDDPVEEVVRVRALDPQRRGRVLGTVSALGVDPDRVLVADAPSPGEARKLALARLLVDDASVLVLDEPTNHLDLPSIERLQEALGAWPGALLLVTHDERLAEATATTRWHVEGGGVSVVAPT